MDDRFQTPPRTVLTESGKYAPISMFISSECADYTNNNGDMLFNLRQDISVDSNTDIYISLSDFVIANSEYLINANNARFFITKSTVTYTVSIPHGNYIVTGLVAAINAAFVAHASPNINTLSVSFNGLNNTFSFSSTDVNQFELLGGDRYSTTPYSKSMLRILGFPYVDVLGSGHKSVVVPAAPGPQSNTLTAGQQCDLSGVNSFFVCTNLHTSNYSFMMKNQGRTCNILQKIQVLADSTGINFFSNTSGFKTRIFERNITFLHMTLFDEDFLPFSPTSKWSCTINFFFFNSI